MKATFVRVDWENLSHTVATFYFQPAGNYRYEAGQYAVISLPHSSTDTRGTSRTMTLSSSPSELLLSFTMRIYPKGGSSFKQALLDLKSGAEISIQESLGDLVLPLDPSIPLVFVAGGVGIASYTGMVKWLTEHDDKRNISLHYAVANSDDIILQQPFEAYGRHYPFTAAIYLPEDTPSLPTAGVSGMNLVRRRLTVSDILQSSPDALLYLSGTEQMVENIRHELIKAGRRHSQIVFDYFDGYSELY